MKNVEDVLPLSPMQELMLLHLASARGSEALLEQSVLLLRGSVDAASMRDGWQRALNRNAALRASFAWQGLSKPVQVIQREVVLPWQELDWRDQSQDSQRQRLELLLAEDRRKRFEPNQAPLLRVYLVRTGNDAWWMLLSAHHILIDRWSIGILLQEVLTSHAALRQGDSPSLQPLRPYREYLAYLQRCDGNAMEEYWRDLLAGAGGSDFTLPSDAEPVVNGNPIGIEEMTLDEPTAGRLRESAQRQQLTLSTLAQAALAIALAKLTQSNDVLFGVTVSSRPPELAGVERMIGMFSNNLPVRVRLVPRDVRVADWLQTLQRQQAGLNEHSWSPLPLVRELAGLRADQPMFECLLVFQNDPAAETLADAPRQYGLCVEPVAGHSRTTFPLTVMISQAPDLRIHFVHDRTRVGTDWVRQLAREMQSALRAMSDPSEMKLSDLLGPPPLQAKKMSLAESVLRAARQPKPAEAALRSPMPTFAPAEAPRAPSTPTEQAIAQVWRELLRLERVNLHDNFFDIGGTSVLAVQAVQRLKKRSNLKINPMQMAVQTLGQLASTCAKGAK